MKKLTPLVLVAAFGALMFGSCKKDYTCTCTDVPVLGTVNAPINNAKKKDAKDACQTIESSYNQYGTTGVSCSI